MGDLGGGAGHYLAEILRRAPHVEAYLVDLAPTLAVAARVQAESPARGTGAGRKRGLRTNSLIAATAILAGAELASYNAEDFAPFIAHGLQLLAL